MKKLRRLSMESLERRIMLDGKGLVDSPAAPPWQSVIVALNDNIGAPGAAAERLVNAHGGQLGHVYEHAIKGFSAELPDAAIQALLKNPQVKRIEPDLAMQAFAQVTPTGVDRIEADLNTVAQINGQDERVDVDIAIIDTGIDGDHPDLNVAGGYNATAGSSSNWDDGHGHGTHVAGTAAALDNDFGVVGVAPGARLWAVKVLGNNGSGRLSDIIEGIDWVTANAATIEVANMSLGGQGVSLTYREAIQASVGAGVVYVVASGNEFRDILGGDKIFGTSDDTIPAAYPEVATISALADSDGQAGGSGSRTSYGNYLDDTYADFSNFSNADGGVYSLQQSTSFPVGSPGMGIDLVLPGVDILSTYKGGGYATSTGTSMAAPHATGLAALYIAEHGRANDADGVYAIRQALIDNGKAWRSTEGLELILNGGGGNDDSPDQYEENLGWAANTAPDNTPPDAPSGLSAVAGSGQVVLDWADNTESDLAGYNVYRSTTSGSQYEVIAELVNSSSYTDTGVAAGTYFYIVTALDWSGNESAVSDEVSATVADTPPAAPSGLSAVAGNGQVVLDWADNTESDLAGYNVYRRVTGGSYDAAIPVSSSSYTDTGVANGTTYYYVVTAVDLANNESDNSSEVAATPVDQPETLHVGDLDASSTNQGKSWTASVTIAVHYGESPVSGAVVTGNWGGGASGVATCTTNGSGSCTVEKSGISKRAGVVSFSVTDVTSDSGTYEPASNHDPDLESDGTTIDVNKPLLVAGGSAIGEPAGELLTEASVRPAVNAAISHWAAAGVAPNRLNSLRNVVVEIADLDDALLGLAYTDWVVLDRDAAGYGWSTTSRADRSLRTGAVDLFSALTHEFGHVLGLEHHDREYSVMASQLRVAGGLLPGSGLLGAIDTLTLAPLKPPQRSESGADGDEYSVLNDTSLVAFRTSLVETRQTQRAARAAKARIYEEVLDEALAIDDELLGLLVQDQ